MNDQLWHFLQIGHTYPNPDQNKEDSDFNHQIAIRITDWDYILHLLTEPFQWMQDHGFKKRLCLWMPFGDKKYEAYSTGRSFDGKLRFDSFYLASQSSNARILNLYHKFQYFCEAIKQDLKVDSIMLYNGSLKAMKESFDNNLVSYREYLPLVRQSIASPLDETVLKDDRGNPLEPYYLAIDEGTKLDESILNTINFLKKSIRNNKAMIALEGRLNTDTPSLNLINDGTFCNMVMARDIKENSSMLPRNQIQGPRKYVMCTNMPSNFEGDADQQRSDWTKQYLSSGDDVLVNVGSLIKTNFQP